MSSWIGRKGEAVEPTRGHINYSVGVGGGLLRNGWDAEEGCIQTTGSAQLRFRLGYSNSTIFFLLPSATEGCSSSNPLPNVLHTNVTSPHKQILRNPLRTATP